MDPHQQLQHWMAVKGWRVVWRPDALHELPEVKDLHDKWLQSLYESYPLIRRQHMSQGALGTKVQLIACNISSTLPGTDVGQASIEDIESYNEDLTAYIAYINNSSVLNDGVQDLKTNVVVAVAPERKNGNPWFSCVLEIHEEEEQVTVRWMDRQKNKTVYFYLTGKVGRIHFETIICNGVQMEPMLAETLMWKLVTPLPFIQSMNTDSPPTLQQNSSTIKPYKKRKKFDMSEMIFANSNEFLQFAKVLL